MTGHFKVHGWLRIKYIGGSNSNTSLGQFEVYPWVNLMKLRMAGQIAHTKWYELFPDPTIADAIMDRIIHNSYILALDSKKSMREVMAEKIIQDIEKNG
jgi:DNA replication protein DnaC